MTTGAEIRDVGWERIQLVFHLAIGAPLGEGARFALRRDDGPGSMPPTHADIVAGEARLRFNVMLGADQMPLVPGRWALVLEDASGGFAPVPLAETATIDPTSASRRFDLDDGHYDVIASLVRPDRRLDFSVDRVVTATGRESRGPVARLVRGVRRRGRAWAIRTTVAVATRTARRGDRRRVVFASSGASRLAGNLLVVHDRMLERHLDETVDLVVHFGGRRKTGPRGLPFRELWRTAQVFATADVILVSGSRHVGAHWVAPPPSARYIQLWHASGAFKTVGYSRIGTKDTLSPWSRLHKDYTHVIVSSAYDAPFYAEAFGVPESRVVVTGIPRMDRFFDEAARERARSAAREAFPMIEGRPVILFAPTYRGRLTGPYYDEDRIDYPAFHALAEERDAIVLFKMHPDVRRPLAIPDRLRDRLIDATRTRVDVNDLLFSVDLLITDYSSIFFEYSVLGRPMLFYAYDLDAYVGDRDFYVPFETSVPGRIVRTFDELLDCIRREDYAIERATAFAAEHFAHLDAGSTDRVIDQLILGR